MQVLVALVLLGVAEVQLGVRPGGYNVELGVEDVNALQAPQSQMCTEQPGVWQALQWQVGMGHIDALQAFQYTQA